MRLIRLLLVFIILFTLAGCLSKSSPIGLSEERQWTYGDLRVLDPPDEAGPSQEIIAAYTRLSDSDLEIRIDFLESRSYTDYDLFLAIDNQPGGNHSLPIQAESDLAWEILISFRIGYPTEAITSSGQTLPGLSPRLYRDLTIDSALIRINQSDLGLAIRHAAFQVWVTSPASRMPSDSSLPFRLDGNSPGRAPLLLTFWNTLPAYTPAQALRRWNGAHTGPQGNRHGLFELLGAANRYRVPLTLLDLKTPNSLAGLEILGGLPLVKNLNERGLLLLPDVAFGDPAASGESIALSKKTVQAYGLRTSPFIYGPVTLPLSETYQAAFSAASGDQIINDQGVRLIPLPDGGEYGPQHDPDVMQVSEDGLSLDLRRMLVKSALTPGPSIITLGGDVQETSWADAIVAFPTFAYIAAHPWIWVLSGTDLLTLRSNSTKGDLITSGCNDLLCSPGIEAITLPVHSPDLAQQRSILRQALSALPSGPQKDLAWEMYLRLTSPTKDTKRAQLQAEYLGQVNYLLEAANWMLHPNLHSDCGTDIDWDGIAECILTTDSLFAILEPDGGRLIFGGQKSASGFEEWIGPSSQFSLGLGDPAGWELQRGQAADPEVIPGGFADLPDSYLPYRPIIHPGKIEFVALDGSQTKVYSLIGRHIRVEYRKPGMIKTRISLAYNPQVQQQSGWEERYSIASTSTGRKISWGLESPERIQVESNTGLVRLTSFLDSQAWMHSPEDPDRSYPPGHFLPLPLSVVDIETNGSLIVEISPDIVQ